MMTLLGARLPGDAGHLSVIGNPKVRRIRIAEVRPMSPSSAEGQHSAPEHLAIPTHREWPHASGR